jgi:integrase
LLFWYHIGIIEIMAVLQRDLKKLKYLEELNIRDGLKVRGGKSYTSFLFRKKLNGKMINLSIGKDTELSLDEAEEVARVYRKLVSQGIHPKQYEEEQTEIRKKEEAEKLAKTLTLRELLENYENTIEMYGRIQAESTIKRRRGATNLIWAEYMDQPISAITKKVVEDKINEWSSQRVWRGKRGSLGAVMRSCDEMSAMYNFAKTGDLIDENPFDIRKLRFPKRNKTQQQLPKYYLNLHECETLSALLLFLKNPTENEDEIREKFGDVEFGATIRRQRQMQYDAVALILLTGLRKVEVLSLKWEQMYIEPDQWGSAKGAWFEFTKSKQNEPMGVPITNQMMPFIQSCAKRRDEWLDKKTKKNKKPRTNFKEYLFPSLRTDSHITTIREAYDQINSVMPKLANAPDGVGSQVLRKTFATTAYDLGYSFEQIGLFTGHTSSISNPNVATDAYVKRQADAHRDGFQTINEAQGGTALLAHTGFKTAKAKAFMDTSADMGDKLEELQKKRDYFKEHPEELTPEKEQELEMEIGLVEYDMKESSQVFEDALNEQRKFINTFRKKLKK